MELKSLEVEPGKYHIQIYIKYPNINLILAHGGLKFKWDPQMLF